MGKLLHLLKRFIVLDIFVLLFICGITLFIILHGSDKTTISSLSQTATPTANQTPVASKIWQIIFSFNTQTQQLSMKSVIIKNGVVNALPGNSSRYKLLVLDKNQKVLFRTDIVIAERILYNVYFPAGS